MLLLLPASALWPWLKPQLLPLGFNSCEAEEGGSEGGSVAVGKSLMHGGIPPPVGTRCLRTPHRSVPQPQAALPAPPLGFQGCFGPTAPWQHAKSGRGHLRFLEAAVLIRRGPGAADTAQLPPPRGFSKKRRRVPRSSGGSHGRVGPGGGGGNGAGREWWWLGGWGRERSSELG